jgi:predicted alpha/beta hydrolase family esterase
MRRWAAADPKWVWAPEPPAPPLVFVDRIAALEAALAASDEPALVVAHAAGCLATAMWAASHTGPVHAALLVTPPSFEGPEVASPDDVPWRVPLEPLPFRSVVVASRTDPYCTFDRSRASAEAWGASLVDAGDAGHLDTKSGFGPWVEGELLVADLRR